MIHLFRSGEGPTPGGLLKAKEEKEKTHEDYPFGYPTAAVPSQISWF